jgi:hypothetical protein
VRLWTTKGTDWPRGIRLEGSADGETWRRLAADSRSESTVRWAGIALLRDDLHAIVLEFAPTPLKALRLTVAEGHPRYAWSVNELIVYAAD